MPDRRFQPEQELPGQLGKSLQQAAWRAITIAVEISYPTKQTIKPILQKAHRNARHLALECNIYSKDMIEEFIRRAYLHAKTLETKIGG